MDRICIIAEAGVNHNGSLSMAKDLIRTAKECGADIVKFQTAKLDSLVSRFAPMAEYQRENTGREESQKEMLKRLLLPFEAFPVLAEYCQSVGIRFLSTPFDLESISFLNDLQELWKIPSGEITNLPYLRTIGRTGKPVILSTGMSEPAEIAAAVRILRDNGTGNITLLHCTTEYPAPPEEVNLRAMETLRREFELPVGYSDHTQGIEIPIAAAALGAVVIEKHFTLDRNLEGPDHKASLEPDELAEMIRGIRKIELALGDGVKRVTPSEAKNQPVARKSIVAAVPIRQGELLTENMLTVKRPGNGISPMRWDEIIGTYAVRDFQEDELLCL